MIGRIRGTLLEKQSNQVLVDVNGLAYEVAVPMSTLYHLPENGQAVSLHTHLVVREDAQLLYGFYELNERTLFRLLIKLNGVGPKMALGILSGLNVHELANCVRQDDVNTLVRLPGVGKKTAERLIVELRGKLTDWYQEADQLQSGDNGKSGGNSGYQDAESALIALGYKPQDAGKAISRAAKKLEEDKQPLETSQLVRLALRDMTG